MEDGELRILAINQAIKQINSRQIIKETHNRIITSH
jgi:hypothetical protein